MRMKLLYCIMVYPIVVMIMCGCSRNLPIKNDINNDVYVPNTTNQSVMISSYPAPEENIVSIMPGSTRFPDSAGVGMYAVDPFSNNVLYSPFDNDASIVYCPQTGCNHSDDSCFAHFENMLSFAEYHNKWYIIRTINDTGIQLVEADPASQTKREVYTWNSKQNELYTLSYAIYGNNFAYLAVTVVNLDSYVQTNHVYRVELSTGKFDIVSSAHGSEFLYPMGGAKDHIVIASYAITALPNDEVTYFADNPSATHEEYNEYYKNTIDANTISQLRCYTSDGTTYTVIADSKNDGYIFSGNVKMCYEHTVLYQCNNTLYLYDIEKQKSVILWENDSNIVNYWYLDNHAHCIIEESEDLKLFVIDAATGAVMEPRNAFKNQVLRFFPNTETNELFLGIYMQNDGTFVNAYLAKEAFYMGMFDLAIPSEDRN